VETNRAEAGQTDAPLCGGMQTSFSFPDYDAVRESFSARGKILPIPLSQENLVLTSAALRMQVGRGDRASKSPANLETEAVPAGFGNQRTFPQVGQDTTIDGGMVCRFCGRGVVYRRSEVASSDFEERNRGSAMVWHCDCSEEFLIMSSPCAVDAARSED